MHVIPKDRETGLKINLVEQALIMYLRLYEHYSHAYGLEFDCFCKENGVLDSLVMRHSQGSPDGTQSV